MHHNPYVLTAETIKEPPVTFKEKIKFLGPGFVLSASIVGSGELIATTTLGARAGFITFWVILVSCLLKVFVQLEFGKHTILTGESAMAAFNKLPGPKFGKAKWSVWSFLVFMLIKLVQVGGIVGGVGIILNITMPAIHANVWTFVVAVFVALLVFRGYYAFIEKFSLWMIGLFTVFTLVSCYFLQYTSFAISLDNVFEGLRFQLPKEMVGIAIAAFGITGVGGDEIIYYNYWCLEKGYAAHSGPPDDSEAWVKRANGWIKVMHLDAILAMVFYTTITAAFYLLGAAVLHAQGDVPEGYQMIETLSAIYTESLGTWAKTAFLVGAFVVLFSTLFSSLAAWTREYSDIFGQIGWIDFYDEAQRRKLISILAWVFPFAWALLFVFIKLPVIMVLSGGIVGSLILLLVVFAVFHFRYVRLHPSFKPSRMYDLSLWLSALGILWISGYGLYQLLA
jgi:Mn2+/Fe2+ NRAMP family transporter